MTFWSCIVSLGPRGKKVRNKCNILKTRNCTQISEIHGVEKGLGICEILHMITESFVCMKLAETASMWTDLKNVHK